MRRPVFSTSLHERGLVRDDLHRQLVGVEPQLGGDGDVLALELLVELLQSFGGQGDADVAHDEGDGLLGLDLDDVVVGLLAIQLDLVRLRDLAGLRDLLDGPRRVAFLDGLRHHRAEQLRDRVLAVGRDLHVRLVDLLAVAVHDHRELAVLAVVQALAGRRVLLGALAGQRRELDRVAERGRKRALRFGRSGSSRAGLLVATAGGQRQNGGRGDGGERDYALQEDRSEKLI
ncbi:hypothetical protein ACFQ05_05295 [Amycolatopsis umgeniensis]|uniref:Uncharacterized protein n=1 Tax=Amycolatopsis umgeniensis TaxID=336628 RepID=A0A841AXU1_9PSEU|nr:hypothetical protein [Amycolatopsis umgeniensis]MBB5852686.1 hypothetical protein [Amycolatopsis umgeniensis]